MDRMQLMLEADRRGILPPEQKALLDEAVKSGLVGESKSAAVSAGESIMQIPRQLGLTARYAAEGLADVAGIATEPIRMAVNPALRAVGLPTAPSTRAMVSGAADAVGLPSPQGANERVIGDASRMLAGAGGLAKGAQALSTAVANPIAKAVTSVMGENVGLQSASAAGAGAAGGAVREAGGGPGAQFVGSVAGGLGAAGAASLAQKAYAGISNAVQGMLRKNPSVTEVNVILNQILEQNGLNVSQIPGAVRNELAREMMEAKRLGRDLNPDVVRRIADYGAVGATPTRGTVTLDPGQITREQNIAKIGMNSDDKSLQQLGKLKTENNAKLIEGLNNLGAARGGDRIAAGEAATGTIQARDAAARATEKSLYGKARDSAGRTLDLDREGFIFDAYNRLGTSNKSAFLPENIKSLLEQIRTGVIKNADGTEMRVPFNVDVIDNLKTTLATAQRSSGDGNVRQAISQVRSALDDVVPKVQGRQVGGSQIVDPAKLSAAQGQADDLSAQAMSAFDKARRFAKARRNWQESAPGIAAALDDVAPDRFVQDFILSPSNKAATAEVEKLMFAVRKNPEAMQAVKENIVGYFKSKALNGANDEVANFSQSAYNKALDQFGDRKLRLFFKPDEIAQLKAIGRVASYETFQPRGAAVNNSNTAGAVAGLLDKIASNSLLSRVPVVGSGVKDSARAWSAQIGTKQALDALPAISKGQEAARMRIEQLFGPGLLLAAPSANSRND